MADKLRIDNRDNEDAYVPSDSEDNYSEEEKEILKEVRQGRRRPQDSKKEVLAFADSDEEGDDDADDDDVGEMMGDSDIEGADDGGYMPDSKDWGSQSRHYYNTDFVDPDYSTYNEKEAEMAKQEEEEAKVIQMRLAKQMTEDDFLDKAALKMAAKRDDDKAADKDGKRDSTKLKADFSGLSKRERLRLFQKDSPEFPGLISTFQAHLSDIETLTSHVLKYVREHDLPLIPALKFAQLYQSIRLTYCSNVTFYLLLKAKRVSIRSHPLTKRLVQMQGLLAQLDDKYQNIIKPQLEALLERIVDGDKIEILDPQAAVPMTKKSKLSILDQYEEMSEPPSKRTKVAGDEEKLRPIDAGDSSSDDGDDAEQDDAEQALAAAEAEEEAAEAGDANERRHITYQIAKNKGLMPQRKKEQRNPRVKHRSKFRKALIRRKGAVRTVRTETKRYAGEISGIKASVSKSIKFKS